MSGSTLVKAAKDTKLLQVDGWDALGAGREDPEFRSLLRNATWGIRQPASSVARVPRAAPPRRDQPVGRYVIVVLILALAMMAVRLTTPSASGVPSARVHDTAGFVGTDRTAPSTGRFLVPTVTGSPSAAAAHEMAASQESALAAAEACAGVAPGANGIAIDTPGVSGGSAGLMLALTVLDQLAPEDLLRGRTIAGTGVIHADGRVDPVGDIGLKAAAAERAGADLLLVPRGQDSEAAGATQALRVVAVGSLSEAVQALGGTGCRAGPAA